jgi:nitroreductase
MDFKTLLANRRSIRDFLDREVPLSVVEEIIRDTSLAPSESIPPASERRVPEIVKVI